jgi:molybdenum cofactor biosynthesis protein B
VKIVARARDGAPPEGVAGEPSGSRSTMGHEDHKSQVPSSIGVAVITVSDTRTMADDSGGALAKEMLGKAGHPVRDYRIIRDEPSEVRQAVQELAGRAEIRALVLTGGTGLSPRDRTCEAVSPLFDLRLDGFGELFRFLSFREIGSPAMLSRAVAGVVGTAVVFALPGSPAAVRLALDELILPELGHIVAQLDNAGHGRPRH